jgi:hypothetical protein
MFRADGWVDPQDLVGKGKPWTLTIFIQPYISNKQYCNLSYSILVLEGLEIGQAPDPEAVQVGFRASHELFVYFDAIS